MHFPQKSRGGPLNATGKKPDANAGTWHGDFDERIKLGLIRKKTISKQRLGGRDELCRVSNDARSLEARALNKRPSREPGMSSKTSFENIFIGPKGD